MSDYSISRNPITRTGSADYAVSFDYGLVGENKNRESTYYDKGSRDDVYNVLENSLLITSKKSREIESDKPRVIACANGLGADIDAMFPDDSIRDELKRALIMEDFYFSGMSVFAYNITTGSESGFTATGAGTSTLWVMQDVPAACKLIVTVPRKKDLRGLRNPPDNPPGRIPLIAVPADDSLPGHILKQAVNASLHQKQNWESMIEKQTSRGVTKYNLAAHKVANSAITNGIVFLDVLLQLGIVNFKPLGSNENADDDEWRGSVAIRRSITKVLSTLNLREEAIGQDGDIDIDNVPLRKIATAVTTELAARILPPTESPNRFANDLKLPSDDKRDAAELRHLLLTAMFQDAERGKVTSLVRTTNAGSQPMLVSTEVGYMPGNLNANGQKTTRDEDMISAIRQSVDQYSTFRDHKYFATALQSLRNNQVNHFTEAVSAYNIAIDSVNRLTIGRSVNSAKAGSNVDVVLGSHYGS